MEKMQHVIETVSKAPELVSLLVGLIATTTNGEEREDPGYLGDNVPFTLMERKNQRLARQ